MLEGLNELQKSAVLLTRGPILIVAGPGTGKTRTLTTRIAYLIKERAVLPDNILAITFTRKAAREMRERLRLPGTDTDSVTVDTIHSVCLRILRKDMHRLGRSRDFSIVPSPLPSPLRGEGGVRGLSSDDTNLLDFDDLISLTIELFEKHPDILKEYRGRYHYIFVDEYQDIDQKQRHLIALLTGPTGNICAIGDPDQAIYSFRGANVENFLLFEKDYPETRVIKFRDNYRYTPVIVDASNEVIQKNNLRIDKPVLAIKKGGERVQVYTAPDEEHEGRLIVNEIERLMGATSHFSLHTMQALHRMHSRRGDSSIADKGYRFSDFAVFFRLNAQIKRVEEAFINSGIPYQVVGGKGPFPRQEIRAALSYLHVIDNPEDDWHLLQILNIPNRQMGPQTIGEIQEKAKRFKVSIYELISRHKAMLLLNRPQREGVRNFLNLIDRLRKEIKDTNLSNFIKKVLSETGLTGFYGKEEIFSDLISMAIQYDDRLGEQALRTFLDEMEISSDVDYLDERADAVALMTLHASKGLEFRAVFICGVEDGLVPYTLHIDQVDLEEERRLFYVGMTRAMERLYLISVRDRFFFGERMNLPQSPFISGITDHLKEIHHIDRPQPKKSDSDKVNRQLRLFE